MKKHILLFLCALGLGFTPTKPDDSPFLKAAGVGVTIVGSLLLGVYALWKYEIKPGAAEALDQKLKKGAEVFDEKLHKGNEMLNEKIENAGKVLHEVSDKLDKTSRSLSITPHKVRDMMIAGCGAYLFCYGVKILAQPHMRADLHILTPGTHKPLTWREKTRYIMGLSMMSGGLTMMTVACKLSGLGHDIVDYTRQKVDELRHKNSAPETPDA